MTRSYAQNLDELARRRAASTAENGEPMKRGSASSGANGRRTAGAQERSAARSLVTIEASAIDEQPVNWLWRGRLVCSALNMIEGEPEAGKTSIAIDLLARLSRGLLLPDGGTARACRILVLGAEDALESVFRPRLRVAGADLQRVRFIVGAQSAGCTYPDRVVLPADLPLLDEALQAADLLYVDGSINDFAERGVRTGDDIAMRELLGGLHELARRTGKTVIASRHSRKGGSRNPLENGSGTMGVIAKARSVLGVFRDPSDPDRRLLARVKCNLAAPVPTLACQFAAAEPDGPLQVEWLGEDPRSAADVLAEAMQVSGGGERDRSRARRALVDWLRDGEWKAVAGLKELTAGTGLTWKAMEKARDVLGVLSEHRPERGCWCWCDPHALSRESIGGVGERGVVGVVGLVGVAGAEVPTAGASPTTPTPSPRARGVA